MALVVTGLSVLVVLATGGARIRVGHLLLGPWGAAVPACLFLAFAALRLAVSRRSGGLEGWLVSFYARQGLPPRDAPATWPRALRTGFLLGAGAGIVAAAGEVAAVAGRGELAGLEPFDAFLLVLIELAAGTILPGLLGMVLAAAVLAASPSRRGRLPGGYEAGRRTVIGLLVVLPAVLLLPEPPADAPLSPGALLGVLSAMLAAAAVVFLVVPAAWLRAREGRWGLAVVAGGGTAVLLGLLAISRFSGGGLAPARGSPDQPNVLLVTLTGVRTEGIRAWRGSPGAMPVVDQLATQGTIFREPISPSAWPPAAAASLLCGVYPRRHGLHAPGDRLRKPLECLPRVLAAHGWTTVAFVSSREFDGRRTGFDALFDEYRDTASLVRSLRRLPLGRIAGLFLPPDVEPRPGLATAAAFRDWIIRRGDEPWFAWIELADPWRPHLPGGRARRGRPGDGEAGSRSILDPPPSWALPGERRAGPGDWTRAYERAVRRTDRLLGLIVGSLRTWGVQSRTLLVVTGESGVTLGEDDTWLGMGRSLPEQVIHRPLLFAGRGIAARRAVGGVCSLVDVMPTLLGVFGLEQAGGEEGMDLSRFLVDVRAPVADRGGGLAFSECPLGTAARGATSGRVVAARVGAYKIVRFPGGGESIRVAGAGRERELRRVNPRLRRHLEEQLEGFLADREVPRR